MIEGEQQQMGPRADDTVRDIQKRVIDWLDEWDVPFVARAALGAMFSEAHIAGWRQGVADGRREFSADFAAEDEE